MKQRLIVAVRGFFHRAVTWVRAAAVEDLRRLRLAPARLWWVLSKAHSDLTELLFSLIAIIWGLWLLLPFNSFGSSPSWSAMLAFASEDTWAIWILIIGLIQFLGVACNYESSRKRSPFVLFLTWLCVAAGLIFTSPITTGIPLYGSIAIIQGLLYLRRNGGH